MALPETFGIGGAKVSAPHADGLIAHRDAAYGQKFFDVTQAQGEPVIEVHSMRDDFRWERRPR